MPTGFNNNGKYQNLFLVKLSRTKREGDPGYPSLFNSLLEAEVFCCCLEQIVFFELSHHRVL